MVRINDIIEQVTSYFPEADLGLISRAYVFSAKVHQGQTRMSGEPYLNHPLSVAKILADLNLDVYTVATGLLHDTVEDTCATLEEIQDLFGDEVAFLVDGVTKISKITSDRKQDTHADNFRKMILAMSKDIRVLLVKLADRIHNMRTLEFMPVEKQERTARNTLDIYAPLASRLGLYLVKRELEDLSLRYMHAEMYRDIKDKLMRTSEQRERYVNEVIGIIESRLAQSGIKAGITGRHKHLFSIYNKMQTQNLNFSQIYDLTAFRIIVNDRPECYEVLGIIHALWKPIPGRFKDYISLPKANMYQSLHTSVIGPYGQRIEIQIRTEEMDRVARHGIAAHWKYKEGSTDEQKHDQSFAWLQNILESQKEMSDSREFLDAFRVEVFPDEVFAFTPAGKVIELPKGATPIDFAYGIHTDIGNRCVGAKVNNGIVPLRYEIQSGDVVEILTQPGHHPSRDWLKIVKTSRARTKIRNWIRQQELERSIVLGREIGEKEFRKHKLNFARMLKDGQLVEKMGRGQVKDADDLLAAIGQGRIGIRQVINKCMPDEAEGTAPEPESSKRAQKIRERNNTIGVVVQGMDDLLVRFGKCCNPIHGDQIKGFITRGRGVTIHARECTFLTSADPERIIDAQWDERARHVSVVPIEVICEDKKGLLASITSSIASAETNILNASVRTTPEKKAVSVFNVEINSLAMLDAVIAAIRKVKGVLKVSRLKP
ncbi:MAG: bifunctional (p)ppGpp synthetase/guanosine-3',5'-bis(diphosphate) 3'-pyrophosphohydrolase [Deltaproteobacteria bacterium]|nr:bifunctional (p)ppGpp synthetase/guanosine-3',5'-bis(diphosphate) 3'-pyrophosphohydrolase [Deltaproteobacteria bacterium]